MKKLNFIIIIIVFICLDNCGIIFGDQSVEENHLTEAQTEILSNAKTIISMHEQDISKLESNLNILKGKQNEIKVKEEYLSEQDLTEKEKELLNLVIKHKDIIEISIDTLKDVKTLRVELTNESHKLEKGLAVTGSLIGSVKRINEHALTLPASQYESLKMEVELLKVSLETLEATAKERSANLSDSNATMYVAKKTTEEEKRRLEDDLKITKNQEYSTPEEFELIKYKIRYYEDLINLQNEKAYLLVARNSLAKTRLDSIQTEIINVEAEIYIKSQIASILLVRYEEEEEKKKAIEAEKEKKLDEERKIVAEEQKAKVEQEKKNALEKAEIAVQKQIEETFPEKKRILELEADIHKHHSLIATLKDELITVDTDRFGDRLEFKKKLEQIENILNGANTPDEIVEELNVINAEIKIIKDKKTAIENIISAAKKQKLIINENLNKEKENLYSSVPGEMSKLEREAYGFVNKLLGEELIKLAHKRFEYLEEQKELIETRIERLFERIELTKVLSAKLVEAKEGLSQIKAANVWVRRESNITTQTISVFFSDIKDIAKIVTGIYYDSVQGVKKLGPYLSEKKNIPIFSVKLFIIIAVILSSYFIRRFLKRWAKKKIEVLASLSQDRFFMAKFIPSLLYIMQGILTMFFLFIISLTIAITIPSNAPIVRSFTKGFAIISIYKLLKGLLVESISPYIGFRRWTSFAYFYAKRLFRGLSTLLIISVLMLTLISVLNNYNYKEDVIELLRFIYRMVTIFLVIWIATSQRSILLKKIMPSSGKAFNKFINTIINIIYPLFFIFIISLISIRNLGYVQLSIILTATLIKVLIATGVAYFIYWVISNRLSASQERRINEEKALQIKEFETEEKRIIIKYKIFNNLIAYSIVIITIVVILSLWNDTFKDVVSSPAAPDLFLKIYSYIANIFGSIKDSFAYKFVVAEGRYTTPFKILLGLLALVAAFIVSRVLRNALKKRVLAKSSLELGAQHAITSSLTYILIGIGAIIGLNIAGLPLRSLTIFAGAFGIGIGFGMQNIISNLVSGIIILFERPIRIGDVVTVDNDIKGVVENISIRSTVIKAFDRTSVIVPNSKFLENNVINWVHEQDRILRTIIPIGVAYGSNTGLVKECLLKVVKSHPDVLVYPEPLVRFAEFGDSALIFQLYFWAYIDKRWMAISDINFEIDKIFRENNIEIAFPQRDIHVRSVTQKMSEFVKPIERDSDGNINKTEI